MTYNAMDNILTVSLTVCAFGDRTNFGAEIHYSGEYDPPNPDNPGAGIIVSGAWMAVTPSMMGCIGYALNDEDVYFVVNTGFGICEYSPRMETLKISEGLLEFNDTTWIDSAIAEHAEMYGGPEAA